MKIILRIIAALTVFCISAFVLIQVPSVQDRIMISVAAGMLNASNNLPQEAVSYTHLTLPTKA